MKLVEIQKIVLQPNVTSLVIDNIFSADYDDYVIMVDYGMGNVPNNRARFLDINGNEDSGTEYQLHQIRVNNTGQLFQRSDTTNLSDMFWKYTGNHQIAWFYRPFSASHPSSALVWGVQSAGTSYTEHAHNHDRQQSNRGLKFIVYSGTVYYNTGTIKIYGVKE